MFVGFIAAASLISACAGKSESTTTTGTTAKYQGAGSKWSIEFTGSAFALKKYTSASATTTSLTVDGTFEKYSNQFVKMTVTTSTGTGAPAAGSVAYGLEVPGYAFFLKPLSGNSEPIVMVQSGSCPTSTFEGNWIIAKPNSGSVPMSSSKDYFGGVVATFNGTSSNLVVSQREPVNGTALTTGGGNGNGTSTLAFSASDCSNGLLRVADGADFFDMYFTSSGSVLVKFPASQDNQIIFGSPKATAAVTQADIAATYSALVFQDKASGTDELFPAKLVIPATGSATGTEITDPATDAVSTSGITFSNIVATDGTAAALPNGFFRADLNPSSGTATNGKATCAVSSISSTKIIACTGYMDTSDKRPFFVLARSR